MGEPLSPDRVFDFPMDEPEPQHACAIVSEIGEPLGAEVDEPLVDPVIDELAEPIVEVEEQMVAPMMDMEEDLAMLFGDDDFSNDGLDDDEDDEEGWEMDEKWLLAPVTPPPMPVMPPPSTYDLTLLALGVLVPPSVIEDLCIRMGNLEYGHGQLVKKVITVSDAEVMRRLEQVRAHVEQGQQAVTQRDETIAGLTQQVQTLQAVMQHKDVQIQQLKTLVAEMSSCEGTLMQCILGLDRHLADV
ncbi:hypothetical protein Tco_0023976 [Tanacetum coccineum]